MTYTLKFDPWSEKTNSESLVLFVLLYQAFLGNADNPNRAKSIEETRLAIKVLDAMSEISDVVQANTQNESRMLKREGGELVLDKASLDLVKRGVDAFVSSAPFAIAKTAIKLKDFVDSASES